MCARVFREGTGVGFRLVTGLWVVLGSYAGGLKPVLYIQFFFFQIHFHFFIRRGGRQAAARRPPRPGCRDQFRNRRAPGGPRTHRQWMNEITRKPAQTVAELASARQHQETGRPSWSDGARGGGCRTHRQCSSGTCQTAKRGVSAFWGYLRLAKKRFNFCASARSFCSRHEIRDIFSRE